MNDLKTNRPDLFRTMHGRDYSADTIYPILEEIFRQTEQGKEDPLANKDRDAIWDCKTEEEALEAAMKVLRVEERKKWKEKASTTLAVGEFDERSVREARRGSEGADKG